MSSGIGGISGGTIVAEISTVGEAEKIGQAIQNELVAECESAGVDPALTAETKGAFGELWDCVCLTCSRGLANINTFIDIAQKNFNDDSKSFWPKLGHTISEIAVKIKDLNVSGDGAIATLLGTLLKTALKSLVLVAYIAKGVSDFANSLLDEVGINHTDKDAVEKASNQSKDAGKFLTGLGLISIGSIAGYCAIGIVVVAKLGDAIPKAIDVMNKIEKKIDEFCGFNKPENTNATSQANMTEKAENVDTRAVETKTE